jgi:hypothetical protein
MASLLGTALGAALAVDQSIELLVPADGVDGSCYQVVIETNTVCLGKLSF